MTRPKGQSADDALWESEERFRITFDYAPIGMAMVGADGRLLQVNRACCKVLGYSPKEMSGLTLQTFVHPADLEGIESLLGEGTDKRVDSMQLELRFLPRLGNLVWGLLSLCAIYDSQGNFTYFIAQIQDITGYKQVSNILRYFREHYHLYEVLDQLLWDCRDQYRLLTENLVQMITLLQEQDKVGNGGSSDDSRITDAIKDILGEVNDQPYHISRPGQEKSVVVNRKLSTGPTRPGKNRQRATNGLKETGTSKEIQMGILRPSALQHLKALSPREQEILRYLLANHRVKTIARSLYISEHTVRHHLKSIFYKLGVHSQTELLESFLAFTPAQ